MDVSIIIINFNSSKYTINCIKSIYKYTKELTFEIIVVDNKSEIDDLKRIEEYVTHTDIKFIKSKTNSGFGGGNDLGYQFATGKYLAFINNDAELTENSLLALLNHIKTDSRIGVLGLPQVNEEGNKFKYAYRQFIDLKYHIIGQQKPEKYYKQLHGGNLDSPFPVDLVSGAFMFFRTEVYEGIGGFDTNIFLFYEEMDICLRLKKQGFKIIFYPNSSFIHYMGQSSGNVAIKKEFTVSYLYVIQKNYPYFYYLLLKVILLLKYGLKSIFKPRKHFAPFLILLKGGNSLVYSMRINR